MNHGLVLSETNKLFLALHGSKLNTKSSTPFLYAKQKELGIDINNIPFLENAANDKVVENHLMHYGHSLEEVDLENQELLICVDTDLEASINYNSDKETEISFINRPINKDGNNVATQGDCLNKKLSVFVNDLMQKQAVLTLDELIEVKGDIAKFSIEALVKRGQIDDYFKKKVKLSSEIKKLNTASKSTLSKYNNINPRKIADLTTKLDTHVKNESQIKHLSKEMDSVKLNIEQGTDAIKRLFEKRYNNIKNTGDSYNLYLECHKLNKQDEFLEHIKSTALKETAFKKAINKITFPRYLDNHNVENYLDKYDGIILKEKIFR